MSASAQAVAENATRPAAPATEGSWELLDTTAPFPAAHAALLPTGKILLLPGGRKQDGAKAAPSACLFDPQTLKFETWDLPTDFSLGAQCFLPDGRLLISGASKDANALSTRDSYLFDPASEDFLRVNDMSERGPCPTLLGRGDGTILAVGGGGSNSIHTYEKTSGWSASAFSGPDWPLYPQLIPLASGALFYSGQHFGGRALINPGILHPGWSFAELPQTTESLNPRMELREQGATVLLPPAHHQRVMVIGGGSTLSCDVNVVDLSEAEPAVGRLQPRRFGRANFNTVVLPDRRVLVCGGVQTDGHRSAALEAELFNPGSDTWAPAACAQVPRPEHSSAVLLADGRVLTAGSTDESGKAELRIELYHPPYLFSGERPTLEKAPSVIHLGERFFVETTAADIQAVTLVKPMAVSHGVDCDQRLVEASFKSGGKGRLEAVISDNPNVAIPGRYLLFLLNHRGTPSFGQWVQVEHSESQKTQPRTLAQKQLEDPDELLWTDEPTVWPQCVEEPGKSLWFDEAAPVSSPGVEEADEVVWVDAPKVQPASQELEESIWAQEAAPIWPHLEDPDELLWVDAPKVQPYRIETPDDPSGAEKQIRPREGAPWYEWARPAFIIGSAGLLALSMMAPLAVLRVPATLLFLLFAPGLALLGLRPPTGWASIAGLSIGLSLAVETLLTLAGFYLGIWSAQGALLVLMGVSLTGAAWQLVRTTFGAESAASGWEGFREATA